MGERGVKREEEKGRKEGEGQRVREEEGLGRRGEEVGEGNVFSLLLYIIVNL